METFKELNITKPLLNALDDLGFATPTPIQAKAYPVIMSGKDVVAISQTGTGKTLAYLLPTLRQLPYSEQRHLRVIIVVPTRELVVQVVEEIAKLAKYTALRYGGIYGGSNINPQKQMIYEGLDILVATPGRLMDMILNRVLLVKSIQKLIIDEVDEMLNLGFRSQLLDLMGKMPPKRQNLLFSATLNEDVDKIIKLHFHTPEYVELTTMGTPLEKISQIAYYVPNFFTKINLLVHLLSKNDDLSKVLVFTKNKKLADVLYEHIEPLFEDKIGIIHSNKSQPQRFDAINRFKDLSYRVLIATDIVARGIDISDVTHVINMDTPEDPRDYIHRIGRTGRADSKGISITFTTDIEKAYLAGIEKWMSKKITIRPVPKTIEVSTQFTTDEIPVKRDKNIKKFTNTAKPTGAFHEKKDKNKKVNLGGKRRQEAQRRKEASFIKKLR